jgi:hypothetical protein
MSCLPAKPTRHRIILQRTATSLHTPKLTYNHAQRARRPPHKAHATRCMRVCSQLLTLTTSTPAPRSSSSRTHSTCPPKLAQPRGVTRPICTAQSAEPIRAVHDTLQHNKATSDNAMLVSNTYPQPQHPSTHIKPSSHTRAQIPTSTSARRTPHKAHAARCMRIDSQLLTPTIFTPAPRSSSSRTHSKCPPSLAQ